MAPMTPLLAGKVAIVTGAASTVGKAIATKFVEHGARVILTDLGNKFTDCQDKADSLTDTYKGNKLAGSAQAMACDVRNPDSIRQVIQDVKQEYKHIDILYNNAGISGNVSSNSIQNLKDTMAVNVESVLEIIKQARDVMVKNNPRGGCILCTGSTTGVLGDVVPSPYSISKATLVDVVRAAAAELEDDGVRVNAISPRFYYLPSFSERLLHQKMFHSTLGTQLDGMISKYLKDRKVTADHVANAAVYLASDASKGMTGHNLVLNGKFVLPGVSEQEISSSKVSSDSSEQTLIRPKRVKSE